MSVPLFKDFGKAAKDTLNDDYIFEQKLELKSTTPDGAVFTTSGTRNAAGAILSSLQAKFPYKTTSITGKISTDSKVNIDVVSENAVKGLKVTLNAVPKGNGIAQSGKVTCEYKANDASVSVVADPFTSAPVVASLAVGRKSAFLGIEGEFSIDKQKFLGGTLGLQFARGNDTLFAALQQTEKVKQCRASVLHKLNNDLSVAGEMICNLKDTKCSMTMGVNCTLDDVSSTRLKMTSDGILSLLYSYKLRKSTTLRLGLELNTTSFDKDKHRVGMAFLVDEK